MKKGRFSPIRPVFLALFLALIGLLLRLLSQSRTSSIRVQLRSAVVAAASDVQNAKEVIMEELLDKAAVVVKSRFGTNSPPVGGVPLNNYRVKLERGKPEMLLVVSAQRKEDACDFLAAWLLSVKRTLFCRLKSCSENQTEPTPSLAAKKVGNCATAARPAWHIQRHQRFPQLCSPISVRRNAP